MYVPLTRLDLNPQEFVALVQALSRAEKQVEASKGDDRAHEAVRRARSALRITLPHMIEKLRAQPHIQPHMYGSLLLQVCDRLLKREKYDLAKYCYEMYLQSWFNIAVFVRAQPSRVAGLEQLGLNQKSGNHADEIERMLQLFKAPGSDDDGSSTAVELWLILQRTQAVYGKALCEFRMAETASKAGSSLFYDSHVNKCLAALKMVQEVMQEVVGKEPLCWLLYNGTVLLHTMCEPLAVAGHTAKVLEYMTYSILCMESNVALCSTDHLSWRLKLYITVASYYEREGNIPAAYRAVQRAREKVEELQRWEMADPPVPAQVLHGISQSLSILRIFDFKYTCLLSVMPEHQEGLPASAVMWTSNTEAEDYLSELDEKTAVLALLHALDDPHRRLLDHMLQRQPGPGSSEGAGKSEKDEQHTAGPAAGGKAAADKKGALKEKAQDVKGSTDKDAPSKHHSAINAQRKLFVCLATAKAAMLLGYQVVAEKADDFVSNLETVSVTGSKYGEKASNKGDRNESRNKMLEDVVEEQSERGVPKIDRKVADAQFSIRSHLRLLRHAFSDGLWHEFDQLSDWLHARTASPQSGSTTQRTSHRSSPRASHRGQSQAHDDEVEGVLQEMALLRLLRDLDTAADEHVRVAVMLQASSLLTKCAEHLKLRGGERNVPYGSSLTDDGQPPSASLLVDSTLLLWKHYARPLLRRVEAVRTRAGVGLQGLQLTVTNPTELDATLVDNRQRSQTPCGASPVEALGSSSAEQMKPGAVSAAAANFKDLSDSLIRLLKDVNQLFVTLKINDPVCLGRAALELVSLLRLRDREPADNEDALRCLKAALGSLELHRTDSLEWRAALRGGVIHSIRADFDVCLTDDTDHDGERQGSGPLFRADNTVNTLHADLVQQYFRVELKMGVRRAHELVQAQNERRYAAFQRKQSLTATFTRGYEPMVLPFSYRKREQELLDACGSNHYHRAVLYTQMAAVRPTTAERVEALKQAVEALQDAEAEEKELLALVNVEFDEKTQTYRTKRHRGHNSSRKSQTLPAPQLLSRTHTSMILQPVVPEWYIKRHNLRSLVLFGKKDETGVGVSTNNVALNGLGVELPIFANRSQRACEPCCVTGLEPNTSYAFAVIGVDKQGRMVPDSNGIGASSPSFCTLLPMPLPLLWSHVAITARQLSYRAELDTQYATPGTPPDHRNSSRGRKSQPDELSLLQYSSVISTAVAMATKQFIVPAQTSMGSLNDKENPDGTINGVLIERSEDSQLAAELDPTLAGDEEDSEGGKQSTWLPDRPWAWRGRVHFLRLSADCMETAPPGTLYTLCKVLHVQADLQYSRARQSAIQSLRKPASQLSQPAKSFELLAVGVARPLLLALQVASSLGDPRLVLQTSQRIYNCTARLLQAGAFSLAQPLVVSAYEALARVCEHVEASSWPSELPRLSCRLLYALISYHNAKGHIKGAIPALRSHIKGTAVAGQCALKCYNQAFTRWQRQTEAIEQDLQQRMAERTEASSTAGPLETDSAFDNQRARSPSPVAAFPERPALCDFVAEITEQRALTDYLLSHPDLHVLGKELAAAQPARTYSLLPPQKPKDTPSLAVQRSRRDSSVQMAGKSGKKGSGAPAAAKAGGPKSDAAGGADDPALVSVRDPDVLLYSALLGESAKGGTDAILQAGYQVLQTQFKEHARYRELLVKLCRFALERYSSETVAEWIAAEEIIGVDDARLLTAQEYAALVEHVNQQRQHAEGELANKRMEAAAAEPDLASVAVDRKSSAKPPKSAPKGTKPEKGKTAAAMASTVVAEAAQEDDVDSRFPYPAPRIDEESCLQLAQMELMRGLSLREYTSQQLAADERTRADEKAEKGEAPDTEQDVEKTPAQILTFVVDLPTSIHGEAGGEGGPFDLGYEWDALPWEEGTAKYGQRTPVTEQLAVATLDQHGRYMRGLADGSLQRKADEAAAAIKGEEEADAEAVDQTKAGEKPGKGKKAAAKDKGKGKDDKAAKEEKVEGGKQKGAAEEREPFDQEKSEADELLCYAKAAQFAVRAGAWTTVQNACRHAWNAMQLASFGLSPSNVAMRCFDPEEEIKRQREYDEAIASHAQDVDATHKQALQATQDPNDKRKRSQEADGESEQGDQDEAAPAEKQDKADKAAVDKAAEEKTAEAASAKPALTEEEQQAKAAADLKAAARRSLVQSLELLCDALLAMLDKLGQDLGPGLPHLSEDTMHQLRHLNEDTDASELIGSSSRQHWFLQKGNLSPMWMARFVGFTVHTLYHSRKWESCVKLSLRFSELTGDAFGAEWTALPAFSQLRLLNEQDARVSLIRKHVEELAAAQGKLQAKIAARKATRRSQKAKRLEDDKMVQVAEIYRVALQPVEKQLSRALNVKSKLEAGQQLLAHHAATALARCSPQRSALIAARGSCARFFRAKRRGLTRPDSPDTAPDPGADTVISAYRKAIDLLRSSAAEVELGRALNELGDFMLEQGRLREATQTWWASLDACMGEVDALTRRRGLLPEAYEEAPVHRGTGRSKNNENKETPKYLEDLYDLGLLEAPSSTAQVSEETGAVQMAVRQASDVHSDMLRRFGLFNCLTGALAAAKLARYATNDGVRRKECVLVCRSLLTALWSVSNTHPAQPYEFALHSAQELWPGLGTELFTLGAFRCRVTQVLEACELVVDELVENEGWQVHALPVVSFYEYASSKLTASVHHRAKSAALRCHALLAGGFMEQASKVLLELLYGKNMPHTLGPVRRSNMAQSAPLSMTSSVLPLHANNKAFVDALIAWASAAPAAGQGPTGWALRDWSEEARKALTEQQAVGISLHLHLLVIRFLEVIEAACGSSLDGAAKASGSKDGASGGKGDKKAAAGKDKKGAPAAVEKEKETSPEELREQVMSVAESVLTRLMRSSHAVLLATKKPDKVADEEVPVVVEAKKGGKPAPAAKKEANKPAVESKGESSLMDDIFDARSTLGPATRYSALSLPRAEASSHVATLSEAYYALSLIRERQGQLAEASILCQASLLLVAALDDSQQEVGRRAKAEAEAASALAATMLAASTAKKLLPAATATIAVVRDLASNGSDDEAIEPRPTDDNLMISKDAKKSAAPAAATSAAAAAAAPAASAEVDTEEPGEEATPASAPEPAADQTPAPPATRWRPAQWGRRWVQLQLRLLSLAIVQCDRKGVKMHMSDAQTAVELLGDHDGAHRLQRLQLRVAVNEGSPDAVKNLCEAIWADESSHSLDYCAALLEMQEVLATMDRRELALKMLKKAELILCTTARAHGVDPALVRVRSVSDVMLADLHPSAQPTDPPEPAVHILPLENVYLTFAPSLVRMYTSLAEQHDFKGEPAAALACALTAERYALRHMAPCARTTCKLDYMIGRLRWKLYCVQAPFVSPEDTNTVCVDTVSRFLRCVHTQLRLGHDHEALRVAFLSAVAVLKSVASKASKLEALASKARIRAAEADAQKAAQEAAQADAVEVADKEQTPDSKLVSEEELERWAAFYLSQAGKCARMAATFSRNMSELGKGSAPLGDLPEYVWGRLQRAPAAISGGTAAATAASAPKKAPKKGEKSNDESAAGPDRSVRLLLHSLDALRNESRASWTPWTDVVPMGVNGVTSVQNKVFWRSQAVGGALDEMLHGFLRDHVAAYQESCCFEQRIPTPAWTQITPSVAEAGIGDGTVTLAEGGGFCIQWLTPALVLPEPTPADPLDSSLCELVYLLPTAEPADAAPPAATGGQKSVQKKQQSKGSDAAAADSSPPPSGALGLSALAVLQRGAEPSGPVALGRCKVPLADLVPLRGLAAKLRYALSPKGADAAEEAQVEDSKKDNEALFQELLRGVVKLLVPDQTDMQSLLKLGRSLQKQAADVAPMAIIEGAQEGENAIGDPYTAFVAGFVWPKLCESLKQATLSCFEQLLDCTSIGGGEIVQPELCWLLQTCLVLAPRARECLDA